MNSPLLSGAVIFMLHRIAERPGSVVRPNRNLAVTPEWLSGFILRAKRAGLCFVSIDELHQRLLAGRPLDGLAVLTADDGYRDILLEGLPVLEAHRTPLCLYVCTAFPERRVKLWWHVLEDALLERFGMDGDSISGQEAALLEREFLKHHRRYMRRHANSPDAFFRESFPDFTLSWHGYAERYSLCWDELARLGRSPLVTIGSHGATHSRMSKQGEHELSGEFSSSKQLLQEYVGRSVLHFSYPHGGAGDAARREYDMAATHGYHTAVTTCHGLVAPAHRDSLMSLPRVDLVEGLELEAIASFGRLMKARLKRLAAPFLP